MQPQEPDLQEIIDDLLAEAGEELSSVAADGFAASGRGAVRLRFDIEPRPDSGTFNLDVKLLGYQPLDQIRQLELGDEVEEILESYDPDAFGVAVFTMQEGRTGYFQFTLAS